MTENPWWILMNFKGSNNQHHLKGRAGYRLITSREVTREWHKPWEAFMPTINYQKVNLTCPQVPNYFYYHSRTDVQWHSNRLTFCAFELPIVGHRQKRERQLQMYLEGHLLLLHQDYLCLSVKVFFLEASLIIPRFLTFGCLVSNLFLFLDYYYSFAIY